MDQESEGAEREEEEAICRLYNTIRTHLGRSVYTHTHTDTHPRVPILCAMLPYDECHCNSRVCVCPVLFLS